MSLDGFITIIRGVWLVIMCIKIPVLSANIVDPDQTPRYDLGLNCLSMSLLWYARHKWVNTIVFFHVYKDCLIEIVGFLYIYFNRF